MITGKHIRLFRHLRNYKQKYIAQKVGLSVRTYRKLENEEIPLTDSRKKAALKALGTSVEAILHLEVSTHQRNPEHSAENDNKLVQAFLPSEKELYERLLSEKEALIKQKDEEIIFLRDVLRRR